MLSPKLVVSMTVILLGGLLAFEGFLALTAASTTIYILVFPIATVGPSFVQYVGGFVMLFAGIAFVYLGWKAAV